MQAKRREKASNTHTQVEERNAMRRVRAARKLGQKRPIDNIPIKQMRSMGLMLILMLPFLHH